MKIQELVDGVTKRSISNMKILIAGMPKQVKITFLFISVTVLLSALVLPQLEFSSKPQACIESSIYVPKGKDLTHELNNPTGKEIYETASTLPRHETISEQCGYNLIGWTNAIKTQKGTIDFLTTDYDLEKIHTIAALWDEYKDNVYISSIDTTMSSRIDNSSKEKKLFHLTNIKVTLNTADPLIVESITNRMNEISQGKDDTSSTKEKSVTAFSFVPRTL